MTESFFYHCERRTLEDVLPNLVERSLARGWRAVIRADSAERVEALDTLLWTYDEQSFLAHARLGDGDPARQPILLTVEDGNPNGAQIAFYVGGARPADWADAGLARLARIALVFDGRDGAAVDGARAAWTAAKDAGHAATYWKETPAGKFEKRG